MIIRDVIITELNRLSQHINPSAIRKCKEENQYSDFTMNKYLAGQGSKIDIYQTIINHFKKAANEL